MCLLQFSLRSRCSPKYFASLRDFQITSEQSETLPSLPMSIKVCRSVASFISKRAQCACLLFWISCSAPAFVSLFPFFTFPRSAPSILALSRLIIYESTLMLLAYAGNSRRSGSSGSSGSSWCAKIVEAFYSAESWPEMRNAERILRESQLSRLLCFVASMFLSSSKHVTVLAR